MSDARSIINSFREQEVLSNARVSEITARRSPIKAKSISVDIDLDALFDIEIEKFLGR